MNLKEELNACADALEQGTLTAERLRGLADALPDDAAGRHQSLLYMQARSTAIDSAIHGYSLYVDGKVCHGPQDPDDWPYQNVAEAIRDGWRVISFPNLALMTDDRYTYGLGCEFVLEKIENGTGNV